MMPPEYDYDPGERPADEAPAYPPHDCYENSVEHGAGPNEHGFVRVWNQCGVCGLPLGTVRYDSVL